MENPRSDELSEPPSDVIARHLRKRDDEVSAGKPALVGLPIEIIRAISLGGVGPEPNATTGTYDPLPPQDYLHLSSTAKLFESILLGNRDDTRGENSSREFSESQRHFIKYLKELPLPELMNIYSECVTSPKQFHQISKALLELATEHPPLANEIFVHLTRNQGLDTDSLAEIQQDVSITDTVKSNIRNHSNVSQEILTNFIDAALGFFGPPPAPGPPPVPPAVPGPPPAPPPAPPPPLPPVPGAQQAQIELNHIARLHENRDQIRRIINARNAGSDTFKAASKNPHVSLSILHVIQGKLDHRSQDVQMEIIKHPKVKNPQPEKEERSAQALLRKIARDPITGELTLAILVDVRILPESDLQEISEMILTRPPRDEKHRRRLLGGLAKVGSSESTLENVLGNKFCDADSVESILGNDNVTNKNLWSAFKRVASGKPREHSRSSSPDSRNSIERDDQHIESLDLKEVRREGLLLEIYKKDKTDDILRGKIVSQASGFEFLGKTAMLASSAQSLEKIYTPIKKESIVDAAEEWNLDHRNMALIAIIQNEAAPRDLITEIKNRYGADKKVSKAAEFALRRETSTLTDRALNTLKSALSRKTPISPEGVRKDRGRS